MILCALLEFSVLGRKNFKPLFTLHCPTGQKYDVHGVTYENYNEKFTEWFARNCDKHAKEILNGCTWDWNHKGFGCSTPVGHIYEKRGYKAPCIIHDMCYESGRPKNSCDVEFRNNLEETGMNYVEAGILYQSVKDWGIIRGKQDEKS